MVLLLGWTKVPLAIPQLVLSSQPLERNLIRKGIGQKASIIAPEADKAKVTEEAHLHMGNSLHRVYKRLS